MLSKTFGFLRIRGSRPALAVGAVLVALGVAAAPASAGTGIVSASCNSNDLWYQQNGPHVYIDSRQLRPVGSRTSQWVAAIEGVYSYTTGRTTWGSWDVYLASSDPNQHYVESGDPDFDLGAGWFAARVVAYAWNGSAWEGPTTNMYVPFGRDGYWCLGR
jgi:hypothetical protein